jgi:hypothetical protein
MGLCRTGSLFGAQRMTPAIARQVVALNFSCGPVLGAVSVALPWIILSISAGPDLYLYFHFLVGFALIMMFLNPR